MELGILMPLRLPSASAVENCLIHKVRQLLTDPEAIFRIVVGYDSDDPVFLAEGGTQAKTSRNLLHLFPEVRLTWVRLRPSQPFNACSAWNCLAKAAYSAGCDLFLMLGDDVDIVHPLWYEEIVAAFRAVSRSRATPMGAACVAAVEETAPGWPCFPVLHRFHLETFGNLFPVAETVGGKGFYNQDADPFLWEVYRRWGLTACTSSTVLRNRTGGVIGGLCEITETRYQAIHIEWRLELLERYAGRLRHALADAGADPQRRVTLDVAVPSYRLHIERLQGIVNLPAPPDAEVRFVIVVDRPMSELRGTGKWQALRDLETSHRDVRVRVNETNVGASESRTRAARECHSEWLLFLDDDVIPDDNLLEQYVFLIMEHQENPEIRGFVGTTILPVEQRQATMAVHLAQITFWWQIAEFCARKGRHVDWGVTANLLLRWWPGLEFDNTFPKTGGGEDIDICISARAAYPNGKLLPAPGARIVHPWWDGRRRWTLWKRAFRWAQGDGMLLNKHPNFTFLGAPNVCELATLVLGFHLLLLPDMAALCLSLACAWLADLACCAVWINSIPYMQDEFPFGCLRIRASLESAVVRQASDLGRFYGFLRRGELRNLLSRRFDWFLSSLPAEPATSASEASCFLDSSLLCAGSSPAGCGNLLFTLGGNRSRRFLDILASADSETETLRSLINTYKHQAVNLV